MGWCVHGERLREETEQAVNCEPHEADHGEAESAHSTHHRGPEQERDDAVPVPGDAHQGDERHHAHAHGSDAAGKQGSSLGRGLGVLLIQGVPTLPDPRDDQQDVRRHDRQKDHGHDHVERRIGHEPIGVDDVACGRESQEVRDRSGDLEPDEAAQEQDSDYSGDENPRLWVLSTHVKPSFRIDNASQRLMRVLYNKY